MSIQPSASKTDLLVGYPDQPGGCLRPFDPATQTERSSSEASEYGTEWHKTFAGGLTGQRVEGETAEHVNTAMRAFLEWCQGANPWQAQYHLVGAERSLAMRIFNTKSRSGIRVRETTLDEESHTYDLRPFEIGGTYDLLLQKVGGAFDAPIRIVWDHKTGEHDDGFCSPAAHPQMRTLALMTGADGVAIMHTPRNGLVRIFAEEISPVDLQTHARALRKSVKQIGDGSMRPGPWCRYCPAKSSCPAKDGELLISASSLVRTVVESNALAAPVDKGTFHLFMAEMSKLIDRAKAEIKADVMNGEVVERPDGKTLRIEKKSYETLSKSSIVRALGKQKGERMIEKLRELGAVEVTEREELWAR